MHLQVIDWIIVVVHPADLFRPRPVLRQAVGQEHLGVLRLRPGRPVVAGRPVHGGHDLQQRHAEPGHRHRPPQRRRRQLGLVGLHPDRRGHGLLLRPAVAPLRGHDRPRVLRDPLFRQGRRASSAASARSTSASSSTASSWPRSTWPPARSPPSSSASTAGRRSSSSACSTSSSPRSPGSGACWSST